MSARSRSYVRSAVLGTLLAACGGDPPASESSILGVWQGTPTETSTQVLTFDGAETSGTIALDQSVSLPTLGAGCTLRSISSGTFARALDGSSIDLLPSSGEASTEGCEDPSQNTAPVPLTADQIAAGAVHGSYEMSDGVLIVRAMHPLAGMIELRYQRVD